MPDHNPPDLSRSEFIAAATPAPELPKATATIALDADVLAWFQQQAAQSGIDWQKDMNGVLRFYMESTEALLSGPEPDTAPMTADDMEAERKAAQDAMIDRHQWERENVHNGSGLSEEFPTDLDVRHAREWEEFEQRYPTPVQADDHQPAAPKPTREGPDFIPF